MKNRIIDESPHKELTLEVTNISYLSIDHIMVRNILYYWYNQCFHYNHCIIKSDMLESHYSKIKRTRTKGQRGELSVI